MQPWRLRGPLTGRFRLPRGGVRGLRDHLQRPAVIVAVMFLGGLIETLYWLRQGGDFMSGRVLLAPLFLLLLPVMVIPLRIPSRRPEDSTVRGIARLATGTAGAAIALSTAAANSANAQSSLSPRVEQHMVEPQLGERPFLHGVASGDPIPDSAIL